jgi:hypothetical protein
MKKLILFVLLLLPMTCYGSPLNLGTFGQTTYLLRPESIRICSTSECLYICGKPQEYVFARIQVTGPAYEQQKIIPDALSYDDSIGYAEQSVLFKLDGTQFILIETSLYDVNGNLVRTENKTIEKKTYQSNAATITKDSNGNVSETREMRDVITRRFAWSVVNSGTPGEAIIRAVLSYVDNNFARIDETSRATNYISVK